jgi:hypothetical protein
MSDEENGGEMDPDQQEDGDEGQEEMEQEDEVMDYQ